MLFHFVTTLTSNCMILTCPKIKRNSSQDRGDCSNYPIVARSVILQNSRPKLAGRHLDRSWRAAAGGAQRHLTGNKLRGVYLGGSERAGSDQRWEIVTVLLICSVRSTFSSRSLVFSVWRENHWRCATGAGTWQVPNFPYDFHWKLQIM